MVLFSSEEEYMEYNSTSLYLFIYTPAAITVSGFSVWCALVLTCFQVSVRDYVNNFDLF